MAATSISSTKSVLGNAYEETSESLEHCDQMLHGGGNFYLQLDDMGMFPILFFYFFWTHSISFLLCIWIKDV